MRKKETKIITTITEVKKEPSIIEGNIYTPEIKLLSGIEKKPTKKSVAKKPIKKKTNKKPVAKKKTKVTSKKPVKKKAKSTPIIKKQNKKIKLPKDL
ncbi:MAG: hypothetical protein PHU47_03335, partial [Candidatus ainarchaeum sp.]|nr:hypothetical protein [Candidatus ainarchaeum sp.]